MNAALTAVPAPYASTGMFSTGMFSTGMFSTASTTAPRVQSVATVWPSAGANAATVRVHVDAIAMATQRHTDLGKQSRPPRGAPR